MKLIDYCEDRIPDYALSYLVNGDASGLEDEDQANIDSWLESCRGRLAKLYPEAHLDFWVEDGEPSFVHRPAFGLACSCVHGAVVALVDNDDPRPEYPLPSWVGNAEDDDTRAEIIEHAARALFACAWADYQDESPDGANLSGCEIMDVMPQDIPAEATAAAETLIDKTEQLNGETIAASLRRAQALPDHYADRDCDTEHFGHYLAMQALGSGVGLESVCDKKALALKLPYTEFSYFDLPEADYPPIPESE
jgi:hypothetical protein